MAVRQSRETIRAPTDVPKRLPWIERRLKWLAEHEWPKGGVEVVIRGAARTNPQNRYYWEVVTPLVAEHLTAKHQFPFTKEMAHDLLKSQFLPSRTCPVTGRVFYGSTTELTKSGEGEGSWQHYILQIQHWAALSGLQIPDPGEGNHEG